MGRAASSALTEEVQKVLASIDTSHVVGHRDKALLAALAYTFARIGVMSEMIEINSHASWLRYARAHLDELGTMPVVFVSSASPDQKNVDRAAGQNF